MGQRYIVLQQNVTPAAGSDIITLISAANRRIRVIEASISGRGTTSAAQQIQVGRSVTGTTPTGAVVPGKFEHTEQPAATFTTATAWAVQPVIEVNSEVLGFNALGGSNRWPVPSVGGRGSVEARNGETISIRASTGVTWQAASLSVIVEED